VHLCRFRAPITTCTQHCVLKQAQQVAASHASAATGSYRFCEVGNELLECVTSGCSSNKLIYLGLRGATGVEICCALKKELRWEINMCVVWGAVLPTVPWWTASPWHCRSKDLVYRAVWETRNLGGSNISWAKRETFGCGLVRWWFNVWYVTSGTQCPISHLNVRVALLLAVSRGPVCTAADRITHFFQDLPLMPKKSITTIIWRVLADVSEDRDVIIFEGW
jgi:hypothetical protein